MISVKLVRNGTTIDSGKLDFLWHPWLYHYGSNWYVKEEDTYTLEVDVVPPSCGRHDKENGGHFVKRAHVAFHGLHLPIGQKHS